MSNCDVCKLIKNGRRYGVHAATMDVFMMRIVVSTKPDSDKMFWLISWCQMTVICAINNTTTLNIIIREGSGISGMELLTVTDPRNMSPL